MHLCIRFPIKNIETLKAWVLITKSRFFPTKLSNRSIKYFLLTDYQKPTGGSFLKLKENAVPLHQSSSWPPVKIHKLVEKTTSLTSLKKM